MFPLSLAPVLAASEGCSVCKDDYTLGEVVLQLPCAHLFHKDCVLPWLTQACPPTLPFVRGWYLSPFSCGRAFSPATMPGRPSGRSSFDAFQSILRPPFHNHVSPPRRCRRHMDKGCQVLSLMTDEGCQGQGCEVSGFLPFTMAKPNFFARGLTP